MQCGFDLTNKGNLETLFNLESFETCPDEHPKWYQIDDDFETCYHFWSKDNIFVLGWGGVYQLDFRTKEITFFD